MVRLSQYASSHILSVINQYCGYRTKGENERTLCFLALARPNNELYQKITKNRRFFSPTAFLLSFWGQQAYSSPLEVAVSYILHYDCLIVSFLFFAHNTDKLLERQEIVSVVFVKSLAICLRNHESQPFIFHFLQLIC